MVTVKDIMSTEAITLRPDSTIAEAIETLTRHGISGAPILSSDGWIVGIISEIGLIDVLFAPDLKDAPISRFMTEEVHVISHDAPLSQLAHAFALYRVRRLPVVENGRLVGIASRSDLLRYCLEVEQPLADPLEAILSLAVG
jgi:CBS domain-containing protein